MKVYVVESGTYSDRDISFITENEQIAQDFCDIHNGSNSYSDYYYTEYDTDEVTIEMLEEDRKKRIPYWSFDFTLDSINGWLISNLCFHVSFGGEKIYTEPFISPDTKHIGIDVLNCEYKDKEKAIKIAKDKVMQFVAEKEGLI